MTRNLENKMENFLREKIISILLLILTGVVPYTVYSQALVITPTPNVSPAPTTTLNNGKKYLGVWVGNKKSKGVSVIPFEVPTQSLKPFKKKVVIETQTPSSKFPEFRPTPRWDHLVRGKNFVPNEVLLRFKNSATDDDKARVLKVMKTFGEVRLRSFPAIKLEIYQIIIKNGDSERKICESLRSDPAVDDVSLNFIHRIER